MAELQTLHELGISLIHPLIFIAGLRGGGEKVRNWPRLLTQSTLIRSGLETKQYLKFQKYMKSGK